MLYIGICLYEYLFEPCCRITNNLSIINGIPTQCNRSLEILFISFKQSRKIFICQKVSQILRNVIIFYNIRNINDKVILYSVQITVLHHNENCQSSVKVTKEGTEGRRVHRSKATGLTPTVSYIREDPTYDKDTFYCVLQLMQLFKSIDDKKYKLHIVHAVCVVCKTP